MRRVFPAILISFCFVMAGFTLAAAQEEPQCSAIVGTVEGDVTYKENPDDQEWLPLVTESCVFPGDIIKTGPESAAAILLGADTVIKINANSDFQLWTEEEGSDVPDEIDMELGEMLSEVTGEQEEAPEFKVNTPSGVVAVRGTEFHVKVDSDGTSEVKVLDGVVEVLNDLGAVMAEAGFASELIAGEMPMEPFGFDMAEFNQYLELWSEGLSVDSVKKLIKAKVKEKVKGEVKKQLGGLGGGLF